MVESNNSQFKRTLVTAALPYVNNVPHLGNLIPTISADVYSRFLKYVKKVECVFVCGTDEHGTATENKAREEKLSPKEICDKYHDLQKESYNFFNIDFNAFGRTSDEENHKLALDIFDKLDKNGYILEDELEQLKCEEHGFLADRYVYGTCPKCGYEAADGDQCESCGEMLNASELVNPKCKTCGKEPSIVKTKHLFIDLPKIEPKLKEWIDSVKDNWSNNAKQMTEGFIEGGLKPRCITRDLKWGIPVTKPGYEDKVLYCWFDAPIGYISITKKFMESSTSNQVAGQSDKSDSFDKWWMTPKETKLVQFLGKDNVPFHTIIFPSFLLGCGDDYTKLHTLSTNEYLNYEGGQFSKSKNRGVFANHAEETGIPADVWRYYLMMRRPEGSDTEFCWDDFLVKVNNELVANIGNLVNRTVSFSNRFFDGKLEVESLDDEDLAFLNDLKVKEDEWMDALDRIELKEGLKILLTVGKMGNSYFQESEPWKLVKEDKDLCMKKLVTLCNAVKVISRLTKPYMPTVSETITNMLNSDSVDNELKFNTEKEEILFKKLEKKDVDEFKKKFSGKKEEKKESKKKKSKAPKVDPSTFDLAHLNIKAAKVLEVTNHPDADKLFVVKLDDGSTEGRTVCAGLKAFYSAEELTGKMVCVLANLAPRKLRGIMSEGMILAADASETEVEVLSSEGANPGDDLKFVEGDILDEITFDEVVSFPIKVNAAGKIECEGHLLRKDAVFAASTLKEGSTVR